MARRAVGHRAVTEGHRRGDAGVILVLWALALPALLGMLVLVVSAGATLLRVDDVQAAADSGAESGSAVLRAELGALAARSVHVPPEDRCRVSGDGRLLSCANYSWLVPYFIHLSGDWYRVVACGTPNCAVGGQVSEMSAFTDGKDAWSCAGTVKDGQVDRHRTYCTEVEAPTGPPPPVGALSNATAALSRTGEVIATLVGKDYGIAAQWGTCAGSPWGSEAGAQAGSACMAYGEEHRSFWVEVVAPGPASVLGVQVARCVVRQAVATDGHLAAGPLAAVAQCR